MILLGVGLRSLEQDCNHQGPTRPCEDCDKPLKSRHKGAHRTQTPKIDPKSVHGPRASTRPTIDSRSAPWCWGGKLIKFSAGQIPGPSRPPRLSAPPRPRHHRPPHQSGTPNGHPIPALRQPPARHGARQLAPASHLTPPLLTRTTHLRPLCGAPGERRNNPCFLGAKAKRPSHGLY